MQALSVAAVLGAVSAYLPPTSAQVIPLTRRTDAPAEPQRSVA
jgi:hypothetical protein